MRGLCHSCLDTVLSGACLYAMSSENKNAHTKAVMKRVPGAPLEGTEKKLKVNDKKTTITNNFLVSQDGQDCVLTVC